jgi:small subunit ribosomal protein S16
LSAHIRLTRIGKTKRPYYRIVVVDSRKKRDGAYIESLGFYQPIEGDDAVKVDLARYDEWLKEGVDVSTVVSDIVKKFRKANKA